MDLVLENTFAERLRGAYAPHLPQGFPKPELVLFNQELAAEMGFPSLSAEDAAALFSGSSVPEAAAPLAQAYAGHQFGSFNPQLGDGRAVLLGEWVGDSGQRLDIHLKGSGPTAFSRGGDGFATLGPVLREYLLGEAMQQLGIPTTRVLAAVGTGQTVLREGPLPGAVLARVATSHLRVGTLQYFAVRRQDATLRRVVDYALERHYPHALDEPNHALALLQNVARAQGRLIARWMHVGFIHGVMNTDNMALSGQTIDYGPCAFMDVFSPDTVFSSIDHHGRYAYGNQASIGQWNIARMGEALLRLVHDDEEVAIGHVQAALEEYQASFQTHYLQGMRDKLGLPGTEPRDAELISELLDWMQGEEQDYTQTFRRLARGLRGDSPPFDDAVFAAWQRRWLARLADESPQAVSRRMDAHNPVYIPRNHLVEEALGAAVAGDLEPFKQFLAVLARPFEERPGLTRYEEGAPPEFGPYRTFCGT